MIGFFKAFLILLSAGLFCHLILYLDGKLHITDRMDEGVKDFTNGLRNILYLLSIILWFILIVSY